MKKWTLLVLFLMGIVLGCASNPEPAKKQEPAPDPKASEKTLNETQNMKDLYKEKVDESGEKKNK